jgi:hypothetical protein
VMAFHLDFPTPNQKYQVMSMALFKSKTWVTWILPICPWKWCILLRTHRKIMSSVDKLYQVASTQTPIYTCIPLESNKMYILLLTTRATGSVAFRYLPGRHLWQDV